MIDFDKDALKRRIRTFLDTSLPDDVVREAFKLKDNRDWKLSEKRKVIAQDKEWQKRIVQCLYRPFDVRWLFYHSSAIDFGREKVMRNMLVENLGLIANRQVAVPPFEHVFVTDRPTDFHLLETVHASEYVYPLYIHTRERSGGGLIRSESRETLQPNLKGNLLTSLHSAYGPELPPELILHYIYAVLYSVVYRARYAEFLRIDFPRIPFTNDVKLFQKLAALGERLVDLHLLRSSELDPPIARFQGEGDNRVQTGKKGLRYDSEKQRVYINEDQYFEGVPPQVWEYQIGGYQVCHKWLKDRKDRTLSLEEIKTYCRIVTALSKTIEVQVEIDKLYPEVEESLLTVKL